MHIIKKHKPNISFKCFIGGLICASIAILPLIIKSNGYFALLNDFSAGAIPQQMLMNWAIKKNSFWNWGIDIGGNWIENLGWVGAFSPFSLLTYIFKPTSIPRVIGYFVILKFAFASFTSSFYFKRHITSDCYIFLGSILYAFSGYQCCSIDFYFFQDVVVFFPLLLVGLELLVENNKKGFFAASIFLNILANFVFFIGEVLFIIIYFLVVYVVFNKKTFKQLLYSFRNCFIEGIIGVLSSSIVIIPFIMNLIGNARADNYIKWFDWFTITTTDLLSIIYAFFLPASAMNNGSSIYPQNWMTRSAYIPLFGAILVLAYIFKHKFNDKYSVLMIILFVMALFPLLNSLFFNLSSTRYNRWFYMIVLIECLISMIVLEDFKNYPVKFSCLISLSIVSVTTFIIVLINKYEQLIFNKSEFLYQLTFFAIGISIIWILSTEFAFKFFSVILNSIVLLCSLSLFLTIYFYQQAVDNSEINFKNFDNEISEAINTYLTDITSTLDSNTLPYRYYFDEGIGYTYYNLAMTYDLPSTNSFLSTISNSVFDLYESYNTERQVMTPYGQIGNQELLGAKYILSPTYNETYTLLKAITNKNGQTFYLMDNPYALPIGTIYNSYITKDEYLSLDPSVRAIAMIDSLIIDDKEYHIPEQLKHNNNYNSLDLQDLFKICQEKESGHDYIFTNDSISFKISLDNSCYVLMSIPYDKHWQILVDGEPVNNVLVSNGLMAVPISSGESTITLLYQYTPFRIAIIISLIGVFLYFFYILFFYRLNTKSLES